MARLPLQLVVLTVALGAWSGLPEQACPEPVVLQATRVIECRPFGPSEPSHQERRSARTSAVITDLAIMSDGVRSRIVAAADDHSLSIWDGESGQLVSRLGGHSDSVRAVALSPNGQWLVSGGNDRTICLWDVARWHLHFQLPACDGAVADVKFHPNGQQLAAVGFDNRLWIVNVSTGQITQKIPCACCDQRAVVFSPDGTRIAAAGRNGQIRLWSAGEEVHLGDVSTDGRRIRALAFSPDGRWLAAAGDGPHLFILDAADGRVVKALPVRPAKVFALAFVDVHRLAAAGSDNLIRLWDWQSNQLVAEFAGHTGTVTALAVDSAGTMLVSGSFDTTVRIWKLSEVAASEYVTRRMAE